MMNNDPLRGELRRLAGALAPHGMKLIIGGGYGLLLRAELVRKRGVRTRFDDIPGTRSTNDIDIFLNAEIITDAQKTALLRSTLDGLGYKPIPGAKYYQFVQPVKYEGFPRGIKIDLLAAPVSGEGLLDVKQDERRIRPRKAKGLHAHTTPEALTVGDHTEPVNIGEEGNDLVVYVPHPFSYLLMKLFALRDRLDDEKKDKGAYHAFDIYRTIAMMTDKEWSEAEEMRKHYGASGPVVEAGSLVNELFANVESVGMVRLRSHARTVNEVISEENLRNVITDLKDLLST
jgi:hypothetical protein